MRLSYKLFISYVTVALVVLIVVSIAMTFVAPANFSQQMRVMRGNGAMNGMMGTTHLSELDAEIEASFQESVNKALLIAGTTAILTALAVSWWASQRIVSPIRSLVTLSQHIADGNYTQRLQVNTGDELAELVESFNRMTESLASTEAMRVQLLGDVTHELKTPLSSIKGYMEGLQDGVIPANPETFQRIYREADRLQRLVQDLQELSRAEAGQITLDMKAHHVRDIVLPVIEHMRPQFDEKAIELTIDVPESLPLVKADFDRTAQVLTNLLGNALQYTESGGTVSLSVKHDSDSMRFTVADTGVGLSPDDLVQIFQRFYRVDKSRSRAGGGSGIGLTIAKHLVETQGGLLMATSDGRGKGSQFSFTLAPAERIS